MKALSFHALVAVLLFAALPCSISAQTLFWDPDGATVGTSISGNWDTATPNWTISVDSGANTAWTQGSLANFGVAANYTVTLTAPITVGGVTLTGTAGALTLAGSSPNILSLGNSAIFDTGSRTLTVSAPITGGFDLTKAGSGTLTLSAANTYSGGTALSAGTVSLGVDTVSSGGVVTSGPFGTGSISVNAASTISVAGGARIIENPIALSAGLTIGGSTALTFRNSTFTLNGGNRTLTVNNTADTTLASNLADDGLARTFTKAGTGRLILSGTNSGFLGPITISAGTLTAGSATAIQANAVLTATGTLDLNGFNGSVVGLAGAGSVNLGSGTLMIDNAGTSRNFTGVISGSGGLIISNAVSQQIEGNNTFSGGILIQEGTLFLRTNNATSGGISQAAGTGTITIADTGATPRAAVGANYTTGVVRITNSIFVASGRGLFFPSNGGTNEFDGVISGPGGMLRDNNGSGLVIITGSNSFSGGLEIDSRTLALGNKNAPGIGTFTIGNPVSGPSSTIVISPLIDLSGANAVTNPVTLNQNFSFVGTNNLEFSGHITLSNTLTITTLGPGTVDFSGIVDGAFTLNKSGAGTLALAAPNTYSGDTFLNAGTLLVNNTTGSGTSTGTVNVGSSTVLGGNGAIAGPVLVNFAGAIGAGNSAGKLTLMGGLDLSVGGTNIWELAAEKDSGNGTAGADFDQLSITGGNLALAGSSILLVQFIGSSSFPDGTNSFWQANHTWKIISISGGGANPGNSNFSVIDGTNGVTAGVFSTSVDGSGNVFLNYVSTTVPRPIIENNIAGAGTTNATIRWSSVNGATYQVQYKNDLNDTGWNILGSVTANGSTASITDTNNPPATMRFYRIVVQ
jgi:autotransporter-associated beta strand protein